jgi:hypothetical protein
MRRYALLLPFLLVACANQGAKHTENLLDASRGYEEGLRWGRYEDAAARRLPPDREAFLDDRDALAENLRIDDYEVIRVHVDHTHAHAHLTVKYTWHLDDEGVVRETVVEEDWVRKGADWFVEHDSKKRGDDMPGVGKEYAADGTQAAARPDKAAPDDR